MNKEESDGARYKNILKSMLLLAAAQLLSVILTAVRVKLIATMLGPVGIGLYGIYTSVLETIAKVASMGIGSSGIRFVSESRVSAGRFWTVICTLFISLFVQGLVAFLLILMFKDSIAKWLIDDSSLTFEVSIIGAGVFSTLVSTAITTTFQGMRYVKYISVITVISSLLTTIFGLLFVFWMGRSGLPFVLLLQSLSSIIISMYMMKLIDVPPFSQPLINGMFVTWRRIGELGIVMMLASLTGAGALLLARSIITRELGLDAAGYFGASWAISMVYVGLLLGSLTSDFYPKLTSVIETTKVANKLINEQIQLILAVGCPMLIMMIGWATFLISMLYTSAFSPAAEILQWQTLGNVLKLASWPLTFAVVAGSNGRAYLLIELSFNLTFIILTYLFIMYTGIQITGVAFLIGYSIYFFVSYYTVSKLYSFRWDPLTLRLIILSIVSSLCVFLLVKINYEWIVLITPCVASFVGLIAVRLVLEKIQLEGKLVNRLHQMFRVLGFPIKHDGSS